MADFPSNSGNQISEWKTLLAFLFATAVVIFFYQPVLFPLADGSLVFASGDLTTIPGPESAGIRINSTYYTFIDGERGEVVNRAFLIEGVSFFSDVIGFSDTQTQSLLILICLLLGSFGIYRLTKYFLKEEDRPIALVFLILFYFLNMWSIDRVVHLWIWFTYALFPLFVSAGLSYLSERKSFFLVSYSIIFAFFGMIPHSLMYILMVHLYLVIFSFMNYRNLKNSLLFAFFPVVIYVLLNLPALALVLTTDVTYPQPVDMFTLQFLSMHGELIDVLTFSNNWWPQINPGKITENPVLRFASLAIIAGTFLVFLFGYKKIRPDEKTLALLALLFILGFVFMAQGTNNGLLNAFFGMLDEGQLHYFALLRESGRIALMIPIFIVLTILASVKGPEETERRPFFAAMLFLLFLHVLSSPIFEYMSVVYSATEVPEDYYVLQNEILKEHKTIWISPDEVPLILGAYRYAWNEDKSFGWIVWGIGSSYPDNDAMDSIKQGNGSRELFDALNIKYIIRRTDLMGASGFKDNYSWMDCEKLDYLTVCENRDDLKAFSIYPMNATENTVAITDFTRVNPTLWYVNISAKKPFMLAFAETYNPLWEARIYENGEKTGTVKPVELYGVINGYQINATGDLHLEMRYAPQDTFEATAAISLAVLLVCIFYLVYSIKKGR